MSDFFDDSDCLDSLVLRPLSHIKPNWELTWDQDNWEYHSEEDSFVTELNNLLREILRTVPPARYHDNEDVLAEYVIKRLNWKIRKEGQRWVGQDYRAILEQGGFDDEDERNLVLAAAGRMRTAMRLGQNHFDEMEKGHQQIFAWVLAIILYHRF